MQKIEDSEIEVLEIVEANPNVYFREPKVDIKR